MRQRTSTIQEIQTPLQGIFKSVFLSNLKQVLLLELEGARRLQVKEPQ